jgi:hypothetical protein
MQNSWWHEILENESYRVVRVDSVNSVAAVLTIEVDSEPDVRHPYFLTVADLDWSALLANFAEPVLTPNGEDAARLVHDMLLARLRDLIALDRDAGKTSQVVAGLAAFASCPQRP